jgi:hypothetical protein
MTTQEILSQIESLTLSEKVALVKEIMSLIGEGIKNPEELKKVQEHNEEILRRRKAFKVKGYHLGKDLVVDRDEIYSERGM